MSADEPSGPDRADDRPLPEKLDDLQAAHPFAYNLVVGLIVGLVGVLIGFHWLVAPLYALSYAALRSYLWGGERILRRQYDIRKVRAREARRRPR